MLEPLTRPGERLLNEMKARYEVDVAGMVAGVRARIESRMTLTTLPLDGDLAERRGPRGIGRVASQAFSSARVRKLVLSHVSLFPVIEGVALTIHPAPEVALAPFGTDLMLLPAHISVNADLYGSPALTRGPLAPLAPSFARFDGPSAMELRARYWFAIASGEGLHVRTSPRLVGDVYGALTSAIGAYLDALGAAPVRDGASTEPGGDDFFRTFHAHGPRRGPLRWIFGSAWAERYSRLLFE